MLRGVFGASAGLDIQDQRDTASPGEALNMTKQSEHQTQLQCDESVECLISDCPSGLLIVAPHRLPPFLAPASKNRET
jgi:hypothetical protein